MSTALAILPRVWACEAPLIVVKPAPQPKTKAAPEEAVQPRLAFYRKYTEGMLRRYLRFSMEAGRVPSMLSREMFKGKVSSYKVHSFEDVVIFVHDVEKCLARLDRMQQLLLMRIAIQEYTQEEAAVLMRVPLRTIIRRYNKSIDALTSVFLQVGLLEPLIACQGGDAVN